MSEQLKHLGLRHVALTVNDLEACERFYTGLLAMRVEWRPDKDNVYLTSGYDNLALHRQCLEGQEQQDQKSTQARQALDHIGFILPTPEAVDEWHGFLLRHQVKIHKPPRQHRDGAKSFYCLDPDDNLVQMIYHPPLINSPRIAKL